MERVEDVEAPPHAAAADDRTRCSFNEDANDTWHSPEYGRRKEPPSPDDSFKRATKSPGNRLGLTQQQWLASRDKQHHLKPTAETARAAEHIRLSFALLEHLSLTLARKGTPFELFGVQVNGGHFRALLSVLSAAVATALVRYIAVSQ